MSGFQAYYDTQGDLRVREGLLIVARTGARFIVGGGGETEVQRDREISNDKAVAAASGTKFLGGSGRNYEASGPADLSGFFSPREPGIYRLGELELTVVDATTASLSDGVDVVAIWDSGADAPAGSYASTSYGEDTYNASAGFSLVLAAEAGGGAVPTANVLISAGRAVGGNYTPVDAANYVSADDPDWTIELQSDGTGELYFQAERVAVRAGGSLFDPSGRYLSEAAAERFNPAARLWDGADERAGAVNPFGILTLTYSWPAGPLDLDTTTTFLDETVGFPGPYLTDYMTISGDDTTAGPEVVTIDLEQAWADGAIGTYADISCAADWYPSAGGAGPATLTIDYTVGALSVAETIYPGGLTPAASLVRSLRINADGSLDAFYAPWVATVARVPEPVREGVVYIEVTEVAGVPTAVAGPFFADALPASSAGLACFPIAESDGAGGLRQLHEGSLVWF